jgi:ElaB/YqjD/DUF883 family membrane-anchored ribosome-binding protein
VADEVTPTIEKIPEKTPEEIEREMAQTRESMTEKVTALENQVVGTVQSAADTVSDTVAAVKSFVTNAPEAVSDTVKQAAAAVSETVKDTFDITGHVRRHPWAAVGTSALIGCIAGWLVSRRAPTAVPPAPAYLPPSVPPEARRPEVPREPGVLDEVFEMIGGKAKELARTALETVSTAIKQTIEKEVPKFVDGAASRLTEPAAR